MKLIRSKIAIILTFGLITVGLITPVFSQTTSVNVYHDYPSYHRTNSYPNPYDAPIPHHPGYYVHHHYNGEMYYSHPYPATHHPYPGYRYNNYDY